MNTFKVPYNKDIILLKLIGSRPFIPINSLCVTLGIEPLTQERRIAHHADKNGLDAKRVMIGTKPGYAIPLEDMSWFLRTIRPQDQCVRDKVDEFKVGALWTVFWYHFRNAENYTSRKSFQAMLSRTIQVDSSPPPVRRAKLTLEIAEKMKQLQKAGMSLREIGDKSGFSASTVCQIIHDKYPVKLKKGKSPPI